MWRNGRESKDLHGGRLRQWIILTKSVYVVGIYQDKQNVKHIFKIGSMKKGLQGNAMSVKFLQWSGKM